MQTWLAAAAAVLLAGCSEKNKAVCCLTAADCESIGLTANDVGDRGCRDGESCVDEICVDSKTVPDASPSDAAADAPNTSSLRCDPTKDFTVVKRLPKVHGPFGERSFSLSEDELTAFVVRDNADSFVTTMSARASVADEFPVDTADAAYHYVSHSSYVSSVRDALVVYVDGRLGMQVTQRTDKSMPFPSAAKLMENSATIPGNLVAASPDATILYVHRADGYVYQYASSFGYSHFANPVNITTMATEHVAISPNGLSLYYTTNPAAGVFRSTRTDVASTFSDGTLIGSTMTDDVPTWVSADECLLYMLGTRDSQAGVFEMHRAL